MTADKRPANRENGAAMLKASVIISLGALFLVGCDTTADNNAHQYNEQRAQSQLARGAPATAIPEPGPTITTGTQSLSGWGTTSQNGTGGGFGSAGSSGTGAGGSAGTGGSGGGD